MKIKHISITSRTPVGGGIIAGECPADELLNPKLSNEEVGEIFRNILNALDVQTQFVPFQEIKE